MSSELRSELRNLPRNLRDPDTSLAALPIAVGTNQLALARELHEKWGSQIRPDGRGRWPTVIAARNRVDDDLCDYIVEAEATMPTAFDLHHDHP